MHTPHADAPKGAVDKGKRADLQTGGQNTAGAGREGRSGGAHSPPWGKCATEKEGGERERGGDLGGGEGRVTRREGGETRKEGAGSFTVCLCERLAH